MLNPAERLHGDASGVRELPSRQSEFDAPLLEPDARKAVARARLLSTLRRSGMRHIATKHRRRLGRTTPESRGGTRPTRVPRHGGVPPRAIVAAPPAQSGNAPASFSACVFSADRAHDP